MENWIFGQTRMNDWLISECEPENLPISLWIESLLRARSHCTRHALRSPLGCPIPKYICCACRRAQRKFTSYMRQYLNARHVCVRCLHQTSSTQHYVGYTVEICVFEPKESLGTCPGCEEKTEEGTRSSSKKGVGARDPQVQRALGGIPTAGAPLSLWPVPGVILAQQGADSLLTRVGPTISRMGYEWVFISK